MHYLLQITIYTLLMYIVYITVLKNSTAHFWSRAYLLLCTVLPLFIPLIHLTPNAHPQLANTLNTITAPIVVVSDKVNDATQSGSIWSILLWSIYSLISVVLILKLVWQYAQIKKFIQRNTYQQIKSSRIFYNVPFTTSSWGRNIFLSDDKLNETIFNHEVAHVTLKHSMDILWIRVIQCIFWPNIILLFIEKELKAVHEFQADEVTAQEKDAYASLLLDKVFHTDHFALSNTFLSSSVSRRITMLYKKKDKVTFLLSYLAICMVILLTGGLFLQSCINSKTAYNKRSRPLQDSAIMAHLTKGTIAATFLPVDKISTEIRNNVVYPPYAIKNNIEGRVNLQYNVNNGKIINPRIQSSPDTSLSRAVLQAVAKVKNVSTQKTINSNLNISTPIDFKINEGIKTVVGLGSINMGVSKIGGSVNVWRVKNMTKVNSVKK